MKRNKIIYLTLVVVTLFVGCQTSIGPYLNKSEFVNPDLKDLSNVNFVFLEEDASEVAATFEWDAASFGYNGAVQYDLQLDTKGNEFQSPVVIGTTTTEKLEVSVGDFNDAAGLLGIPFETETEAQLRVLARLKGEGNDFVDTDPLYSDTIDVTITSYEVVIVYPKLYVPGSYQDAYTGVSDWDPAAEQTTIESLAGNDDYEGYLHFPDDETQFKVTDNPSFDGSKGDDDGDGVLNEGGNAVVTGSGFYKLDVNWATGVYTLLNTTWSVIGSATPGGWDADTELTLDNDTKQLSWTGAVVAGAMKFRANGNYDLQYGAGDRVGQLIQNGGDISVDVTGTYTITLDLNQLPYTYTITSAEVEE